MQVKMPQLGETVIEGTILKWLKAEGDQVACPNAPGEGHPPFPLPRGTTGGPPSQDQPCRGAPRPSLP